MSDLISRQAAIDNEAIVALTHVLVATCDEYGIDTMRLVMDCVKKQARINGENEL